MSRETFKLERVSVRLVRETPVYSEDKVCSPEDAIRVVSEMLCDYDREAMCVINLRTDGTPINCNIVSMGTLNHALAHPREMFKASILSNAATMIMVHNHPGGSLSPSQMDINITGQMLHLTALMGIPLLDHIIVGRDTTQYFSFKEQGLITPPTREAVADYKQLSFTDRGMVSEKRKGR